MDSLSHVNVGLPFSSSSPQNIGTIQPPEPATQALTKVMDTLNRTAPTRSLREISQAKILDLLTPDQCLPLSIQAFDRLDKESRFKVASYIFSKMTVEEQEALQMLEEMKDAAARLKESLPFLRDGQFTVSSYSTKTNRLKVDCETGEMFSYGRNGKEEKWITLNLHFADHTIPETPEKNPIKARYEDQGCSAGRMDTYYLNLQGLPVIFSSICQKLWLDGEFTARPNKMEEQKMSLQAKVDEWERDLDEHVCEDETECEQCEQLATQISDAQSAIRQKHDPETDLVWKDALLGDGEKLEEQEGERSVRSLIQAILPLSVCRRGISYDGSGYEPSEEPRMRGRRSDEEVNLLQKFPELDTSFEDTLLWIIKHGAENISCHRNL
ncbi:hypothetical protein T439DRAFT_350410 [Meredithblackwellia eburnea MCA 4105]